MVVGYIPATVTGTVTDASGAAIPGVALKLENTNTGTSLAAVADQAGRFSFDFRPCWNLPVDGFSKRIRDALGRGIIFRPSS